MVDKQAALEGDEVNFFSPSYPASCLCGGWWCRLQPRYLQKAVVQEDKGALLEEFERLTQTPEKLWDLIEAAHPKNWGSQRSRLYKKLLPTGIPRPQHPTLKHVVSRYSQFETLSRDCQVRYFLHYAHRFAHVIPNKTLIETLAHYITHLAAVRPDSKDVRVLEVGAGLGLFGHLLELEKVKVVATDLFDPTVSLGWDPPGDSATYMEVERVEAVEAVTKYVKPNDLWILLLVWPLAHVNFASAALSRFIELGGHDLVFVGDRCGPFVATATGCKMFSCEDFVTGDPAFHQIVERRMDVKACIPMAAWDGLGGNCSCFVLRLSK